MSAAILFVAACSWAQPGANPYQGKPADAIAHYADIPAPVRARLKARVDRRQYDDVAEIRRDTIQGRHEYTDLRDMHFGRATVCGQPDRSRWAASVVERGLVYCEAEHCVIVPTVCRNVSRVNRVQELRYESPGAGSAARTTSGDSGGSGGGGFAPLDPPVQYAPVSFAQLSRAAPLPAPVVSRSTEPSAPPIMLWAPAQPIYVLPPPPIPPIPEPSTALMLAAGLLALAWLKRSRA